MSHWNHRVVRREFPDAVIGHSRVRYAVHEAYYDDDGTCYTVTEEPVAPCDHTIADLRADFARQRRALRHPVLDYATRKEIT